MEFGSIFELACLKAQAYDLFIGMYQVLPQLTKDSKARDLIETVLKGFLENENWVTEVCAGGKSDDDVVQKIFKFRSIATNFLEGCPYQLIDNVYFKQVFENATRLAASSQSQIINLVCLHGLIDMYTKEASYLLLPQIKKHSKKD